MRRWRTTARGAAALMLIGVIGGACAQPPDRAAARARPGPDDGQPPVNPDLLLSAGVGARYGEGYAGPHLSAPPREQKPGHEGPERKPEQKPAQGPEHKPERKPEQGPEHKPERKPEQRPERKPERKSERPEQNPQQRPERKSEQGPARAGQPGTQLGTSNPAADTPRSLAIYSREVARIEAARLRTAQSWGLRRAPLIPPAPPAFKAPLMTPRGLGVGRGLPPVITNVPTRNRVVFLTIDDGTNKDPQLIRMLRELDVPVSAFLTDDAVRDDYPFFRELQNLGVAMNNHTLSHPNLRTLSYAEQRREICRQQMNLEREFGVRPRLFRPPYGNFDRDTLRAAKSCGLRVVPLWTEEAFPHRIEALDSNGRLHPGDIILTHFRGPREWNGTMADMVRRVLRTATEQGFAVARLEDYV
ncbi:polysaccharide deacetylase family protein [Streptomyces sp. NPDC004647]|uniref:polysaccharide deacetylase family protein n=1 Tax=Streptomyces sp. NPDC004647 TaxID=3154671 RepID=UPI0033BC240C